MDRRDFIRTTSAAVAAAASTTAATAALAADTTTPDAPHVASGERELRLAMPWLQNGRGFDDSARRLAQSIHDLSAGRYRITVLPGAHGIDALRAGTADLYHGSGHDFVALDPAFAYFAGMPGAAGLRPTYLNAWLTAAGGQSLWDGLAADHGFRPLLAGHAGARSSLWSRVPVAVPADITGLRIAVSGIGASVAERLGATPVAVTPSQLAARLGDATIDAVEWGGTLSAYACDLHLPAGQAGDGIMRHCLRPGLTRNGFATVLAVATDTWNAMPPSDQAMITAAVALELNTSVAEMLAVSRRLRQALSERAGAIAFTRADKEMVQATRQASAAVIAALPDTSPAAARIHASYMAFRATVPTPLRRPAASTPLA
jgi:TRAP-type mannitol/chloroaromatic compound transport system substrate-binding protein